MRIKVISSLLFLILAACGFMQNSLFTFNAPASASNPSVVQFANASGTFATNPSTTITMGSNVTSGNILVVFGSVVGPLTSWNAPTGTGACSGLTWTSQGSPTINPGGNLWTASPASSSSCAITVSGNSSASQNLTAAAYECTHCTVTGLGISAYTESGGCNSCTGNALSVSVSNTLVITFISEGGVSTLSAPSPFSTFDINTNSSGGLIASGHYLAASGTYTPTWTSSNFNGFINVSVGLQ